MVTGAKFGAGTDANVFITLFGEKHRQSGRIHLKHADGELFERGHTDTFVIHAADVGRLTKIRWVFGQQNCPLPVWNTTTPAAGLAGSSTTCW